MAVHGKEAAQYSEGVDLSTYLKEVGTSGEKDLADSTGLQTDDRTFVKGMGNGSMSLQGMYSAQADVADPLEIADVLSAALTSESATIFTHLPTGDADGSYANCIEGKCSSRPVSSPIGDLVSVNAEISSDVGVERCVVLHAKATESSDDNSTGVDETASSTSGASAYLQVFSVGSSGTLTVKVQHSSDDSVYADLLTFTAQTDGENAERLTVASGTTINQYVRVLWTLGTGTASFWLGWKRVPDPA